MWNDSGRAVSLATGKPDATAAQPAASKWYGAGEVSPGVQDVSEQLFNLKDPNVVAMQLTNSNPADVAAWYGHVTGNTGDWIVNLYGDFFIVVPDDDFRKHFESPRLPPPRPASVPSWYSWPPSYDIVKKEK